MQVQPNWTKTNTSRAPWEPTQRVQQQQQPSWVNRSHVTSNAWQNTAHRFGNSEPRQNQNYQYTENYSYQPAQNYSTNVQTTNYAGPQNGTAEHYVEKTVYRSAPQNNYQQQLTTYNNPPSFAQQTGQYNVKTTHTTETQNYEPQSRTYSSQPSQPLIHSTTYSFQSNQPQVQSRTTYSYQSSQPNVRTVPGQVFTESSSTSKVENRTTQSTPQPPPRTPAGNQRFYEQQKSRNYERTTEERTVSAPAPPPPASQVVQQNDYNRYYKKTTTEQHGYGPDGRPIPATRTTVVRNQKPEDFNRHSEMAETLPLGLISNSQSNAEGSFVDKQGHNVNYRREVTTSVDPGKESQLLKEEERKVVEETVEPGVISRSVLFPCKQQYLFAILISDTLQQSSTRRRLSLTLRQLRNS